MEKFDEELQRRWNEAKFSPFHVATLLKNIEYELLKLSAVESRVFARARILAHAERSSHLRRALSVPSVSPTNGLQYAELWKEVEEFLGTFGYLCDNTIPRDLDTLIDAALVRHAKMMEPPEEPTSESLGESLG